MCLGLAGRVVSSTAEPDVADVDVAGAVRPINISLLDGPVEIGQWILIHSGFALERMTAEEAHDAMAILGGDGAEDLVDDG
jgi:hydrogenase expression/formation protein HypC